MKNLTPIPPSDPGFQLMEPMANNHAAPPPKFRPQKLLFFLRKFWWMPVVGMALGFGTAVAIFFRTPPIFVSSGSMLETEKLQLPGGAGFSDDQASSSDARDTYLGTQTQLLRDPALRELTLNRLETFATNQSALYRDGKGKDGNWIPVDIQVYSSSKSSVYDD